MKHCDLQISSTSDGWSTVSCDCGLRCRTNDFTVANEVYNSHKKLAQEEKPKIRAWKPEEAIGQAVQFISETGYWLITSATDHGAFIERLHNRYSYEELLRDARRADGGPCGVEVP